MDRARYKVHTDAQGRQFLKDYFTYQTSVGALAASKTLSSQIAIEANSDFVWEKTSYFADLAGAVQTESSRVIPLVNVAITDSGSGRNLQNSAVPISSIAGHEGLPMVLPIGRIFEANATVSFAFTNFSAATTYTNVFLSLIGYKKFYMG